MVPLTLIDDNVEVIIKKLYTEEKLKTHLENLGVLVGSKIMRLKANGGDVIVKVKESRLAINKDLARRIYVE